MMATTITLHPSLEFTVHRDGAQPPTAGGIPGRPPVLCADYKTPKIRICRRLLRMINMNRRIPASLAMAPLKLAEREIIENLLAWDPDVISGPGVRWLPQLRRLLRRHGLEWSCTTEPGRETRQVGPWRRFDPSSKVSIVLPTYNGVKYIRQSIESCLHQTFRNIELIIVDDGSQEDIKRIVESYNDPRIRYFRHERNRGISEGLNTGFRNSRGHYLTWTSDDNYYETHAIEAMVRFLQTYPEVDFVYTRSHVIDEQNPKEHQRTLDLQPPDWLTVDNGIGPCFLYRRTVYEEIGDYNPQAFLAEDYEYWVRVWKRFRMQRLMVPLYYYRFHGDSLTGRYSPAKVKEKVGLVKQLSKLRASGPAQ